MRQRQEAAEDRRVRALQRKLQRSRAPSAPQLEHAPPPQPPSLRSSVAPQPRSQPRQGPSLLQTPASPTRAPSASSSASEFSVEAVETVTLQEGGLQEGD